MTVPEQHMQSAAGLIARCAIVTLSDTRTADNDTGGQKIRDCLVQKQHQVAHYSILPDDPQLLRTYLDELLGNDAVDVIITNGGTGVSQRDHTINVIESLIQIPLPGFGELFRFLSFGQIGSAAFLSRAIAGIAKGSKPLFSLPGSPQAVELAMTQLIVPQLPHLLSQLRK